MADTNWGFTERQRKAFGRALGTAMKLRGLNQVQLAAMMGTTQSVISQWLYGKFLCQPKAVFELENLMDLEPGFLSKHFGYMPMPKNHAEPVPTSPELAVLQHPRYRDGDKAALLAHMENINSFLDELEAMERKQARTRAAARKKTQNGAPVKAAAKRAPRRTANAGSVGVESDT